MTFRAALRASPALSLIPLAVALSLACPLASAQTITPSMAPTFEVAREQAGDAQMAPAVQDIKSLIEQGRFEDAFNLGLKNDQLSGDPLYDYYFGIAAVDSGRASLGVLALERVLLSNPLNDLARLELARGYFVLKD